MSLNQNLRRDLFAIGLFGFVIFLGVALATYDPGDPVRIFLPPFDSLYQPDVGVFPQNEVVQNACGTWGATAADILFQGLGLGAYLLVFSLVAIDLKLLQRCDIDTPVLRLLGWGTALVGFTTLAAMFLPSFSPGPAVGAGGYLGALTQSRLEAHFATAGSCILAASLFIGGLLICADTAVLSVLAFAGTGVLFGLSLGHRLATPSHWRRSSRADAPEAESESEPVAVRVRGKKVSATAVEPEAATPEPAATEPMPAPTAAPAKPNSPVTSDLSPPPVAASDDVVVKHKPKAKPAADPPAPPAPHFKIKSRPETNEREAVMSKLDEASLTEQADDYELPSIELLIPADDVCYEAQAQEVRRKAKMIEKTFADFGFQVKVVEIETGPVIAQYEVELEAGLRLSKITGLADDLAIALRVPSVRIVAPIPGKNTVGIEVPNEVRQVVRLREVIEEANGKTKKMKIPLFLGKDVSGNALVVDLATLPHLLIAGRTGTGKSVCLNAIISSILMTRRPDEVRLLMIDPKMVELSGYGRLPHLMHPVVTDMRKAEAILAWAVEKMEERYALLARAGVRHITSYNQLGEEELMERLQPESDDERKGIPLHLPFIVIVADEMADLMMTAGKEVEQHIIRLAQKSRAVGIHLILATQKPTVDVITGLIKSNLPARIAFQVASRTDSRVVLDEMGADKLLGNGDMLFLWPGTSTLLRGQGTYLSDEEINSIVGCVSTGEPNYVHELVNLKVERPADGEPMAALKKRDELYEAAVDVVIREGRGSVSLLQRALGIGYGRAARLIDYMAEDGIVGTYAGSQAREVLISIEDWERMQGQGSGAPAAPAASAASAASAPQPAPPPTPRRSNKILPEPTPTGPAKPVNRPALAAVLDDPDDPEDDFDRDADADEIDDFRSLGDFDDDEEDDDPRQAESA